MDEQKVPGWTTLSGGWAVFSGQCRKRQLGPGVGGHEGGLETSPPAEALVIAGLAVVPGRRVGCRTPRHGRRGPRASPGGTDGGADGGADPRAKYVVWSGTSQDGASPATAQGGRFGLCVRYGVLVILDVSRRRLLLKTPAEKKNNVESQVPAPLNLPTPFATSDLPSEFFVLHLFHPAQQVKSQGT